MRILHHLLACIAAASLAWSGEAVQLLSNGDFEAGDGKPSHWGTPAGITWEQEDGNRFLRIAANGAMLMSYREVDVRGKAALQLSLRARHQDIKPGEKPWFDGRIMLSFRDADRKEMKGGPGAPNFRGSSAGWVERSIRFAVPAGAATLAVMPCMFNAAAGTLDLDDLILTAIDPELVDADKPKGVDDPALPQAIAPDDPHLRYCGRWDRTDPAGPRSEWPATQVHLVLEGSAINVVLSGPQSFQVVVDGQPTRTVTVLRGQSVYNLASGLPPGRHRIELCKRSEAWGGPVQIRGFQIPADAKLLDPPAWSRRVLFIGDSITAGYGNEAASASERFSAANSNAWLAWGAVAARALDAELTTLAVSGIWLQPNSEGKPPMPELWTRTMPFTAAPPWDASAWQPDAVVVNLGTNDKRKPIDPAAWRSAYDRFLDDIRARHPAAHIFLAIGPMGEGGLAAANAAIAEARAAAGDARVHALALPDQRQADGIGADWHPSVKTHQRMAELIAAAIRERLGW